jgi:hypothetical protein
MQPTAQAEGRQVGREQAPKGRKKGYAPELRRNGTVFLNSVLPAQNDKNHAAVKRIGSPFVMTSVCS